MPPLYVPASSIATDLNISGQSENDLLYFNGASWARVPISPADPTQGGLVLRSGYPGLTAPHWIDNRAYLDFSTVDTSTTSTSYVTMNSMTRTVEGNGAIYLVMFSASGACSSATSNAVYGIHVDGGLYTDTERTLNDTGGAATASMFTAICTMGIVSVSTPTGTIDVRYKTEAGTFTVRERSLITIRQA